MMQDTSQREVSENNPYTQKIEECKKDIRWEDEKYKRYNAVYGDKDVDKLFWIDTFPHSAPIVIFAMIVCAFFKDSMGIEIIMGTYLIGGYYLAFTLKGYEREHLARKGLARHEKRSEEYEKQREEYYRYIADHEEGREVSDMFDMNYLHIWHEERADKGEGPAVKRSSQIDAALNGPLRMAKKKREDDDVGSSHILATGEIIIVTDSYRDEYGGRWVEYMEIVRHGPKRVRSTYDEFMEDVVAVELPCREE